MTARYDIQTDRNGWTVYDTTTGLPTDVNGMLQIGLSMEDADDLADLLNLIHAEQSVRASH
jgi:hypothetical protein